MVSETLSPARCPIVRLLWHNVLSIANTFEELGRRFIYNASLVTVFASQIWMGFSKSVGDFYGAHVLIGLAAAPFEALVAISIADVWFAHERGSKLGVYVFGLAFGSFIGPLCSGFMAVHQGWRWIYWWGAILSGALFVLFFFTCEESRFIRGADDIESQIHDVEEIGSSDPTDSTARQTITDAKTAKPFAFDESDLHREFSQGPKVGDVFDAVGFKLQFGIYKQYPEPWAEIFNQMWRPLKVTALPAVVWVSLPPSWPVYFGAKLCDSVASTMEHASPGSR